MKPLVLSIKKCLEISEEKFIEYLKKYIEGYELPLGELQINAWRDCLIFLKDQLKYIDEKYLDVSIVFEYMLPLERYRRPDVILLFNKKIVILEFKQKDKVEIKDIEQAIGYREDIKHFHYITEKLNMNVECYVVVTKSSYVMKSIREVKILNKLNFLDEVFDNNDIALDINLVEEWIKSKYEPIPSIIEATSKLFFEGDLPYIKDIAEGEICNTVNKVKKLINENEATDKRKKIIFVSGVPGAGKTLVALKILYDYNKTKYEEEKIPFGAVYLSGNGPLVSVLKEQLSSGEVNGNEGKAYIKGMKEYKKDFFNCDNVPENTVMLFDEAQRAWDEKQMKRKYSEPEGLLNVANKVYQNKGYVTVICFIGDGQSIYKGEEQGLVLWENALKLYKDWEVYIPSKYRDDFSFISSINIDNDLFLDTSIRSNFIDTSKWIESLLDFDIDECKKQLEEIQEKGLILRVTRDIDSAKAFAKEFTSKYPKSKYGLLISSKCRKAEEKMKQYTNGCFNGSYINENKAGEWFLRDSVNLTIAASEFLCQGLEIDLPIVLFGGDIYVKDGKWHITESIRNDYTGTYSDYNKIINNTYRVLLSRARKGMILFIPNSPGFNETYRYLRSIGIEGL